ncbi:MAG: hypothetical protein LBS31_07690 [Candidatus Adiutrix sp.]|jgi:hypothetical protein|nr:hypothetical protein [Candidatus Adiutrix sp.]
MQEHFDGNSAAAEPLKGRLLPYVALTLTFLVPILTGIISAVVSGGAQAFFLAVTMLSPIAGMLTAIFALCLGKKRIGVVGKIISIIVISAPLCGGIVGIVALFFALTNGSFLLHM